MHHIFITATDSNCEKIIVAELIGRGYIVGLASDLSWHKNSVAGYLIALQVSKNCDISATSIHEDVISITSDVGAKYYSLIITPFAQDALWAQGNFSITSNPIDRKAFN